MDLNSIILSRTQEVRQFAANAAAAKRNDEQKQIDKNFSEVIKMVCSVVNHFVYTTKNAHFTCSEELNDRVKQLLQYSKNVVGSTAVKSDQVFEIKKTLKEINNDLASEWESFYSEETRSVEDILSLARNVAGAEVGTILADIHGGKDWNASDEKIKKMVDGISNAKSLISKLDLQDNVVAFLRKVMKQEATLADLDNEIMEWISKEKLKSKIKVSFTR